ncbi:cobaltochelatase CobT-related protein [Serratia quinivorans]
MKPQISADVIVFRESVKKVVALLVSKNLPVAERGNRAYCEYDSLGRPTMICIPVIPDNATPGFMAAVRGFLDHEVAHILYTDAELYIKLKDSVAHHLWNAVEDVYIERRMSEVFAGSKRNLISTQKHIVAKVFEPQFDKARKAFGANQQQFFSQFMLVPTLRAWGGQSAFQEFMEDKWDSIAEPVAMLEKAGVPGIMPSLKDTGYCIKVAAIIAKALGVKAKEDEMEGHGDEKSPGRAKERQGEKSKDTKPGESGEKGDAEHSGTSSPKDKNNEDIKDSEPGEQDTRHLEDTVPPWDEEHEDEDDPEPEDSDSETAETSETGCGGDLAGAIVDIDDMSIEEAIKSIESSGVEPETTYEDAMNDSIISEISVLSGSDYRPYDRSYDFLGSMDAAADHISRCSAMYGRISMYRGLNRYRVNSEGGELFTNLIERHLSKDTASTLAKDLERAIASRNKVQYVPGQRRGRIHSPNLYRLTMNDDRVFRKKEEHKAVNACVQVVIDMSGSMNGERIQLATAAAYLISDALDRIKVPNIVSGFTTYSQPDRFSLTPGFSRYEALMMPILKEWGDRANTVNVRARMGCAAGFFPLLNNVDGESILALSSLFTDRTEDKKIMIVLSDGQPEAVGKGMKKHLKVVARHLEEKIDLLGVGIQTSAPSEYYKNYALVSKVNDLGSTVVRKLSEMLLS